ncbi:MAG: N-acyl-L-amino acid amidohydrolase, partial [uncultured Rubrobacteraceae bacterium]
AVDRVEAPPPPQPGSIVPRGADGPVRPRDAGIFRGVGDLAPDTEQRRSPPRRRQTGPHPRPARGHRRPADNRRERLRFRLPEPGRHARLRPRRPHRHAPRGGPGALRDARGASGRGPLRLPARRGAEPRRRGGARRGRGHGRRRRRRWHPPLVAAPGRQGRRHLRPDDGGPRHLQPHREGKGRPRRHAAPDRGLHRRRRAGGDEPAARRRPRDRPAGERGPLRHPLPGRHDPQRHPRHRGNGGDRADPRSRRARPDAGDHGARHKGRHLGPRRGLRVLLQAGLPARGQRRRVDPGSRRGRPRGRRRGERRGHAAQHGRGGLLGLRAARARGVLPRRGRQRDARHHRPAPPPALHHRRGRPGRGAQDAPGNRDEDARRRGRYVV